MSSPEQQAAEWANTPYLSSADVLAFAERFLEGSQQHGGREISDADKKDVLEIIHIHLGMYDAWESGFFSGTVAYEAFRLTLMVRDQKLNLLNSVWVKNRAGLEPVIANCTNMCVTFESVFDSNRHNLTDEVIQALYSLRGRRFDFVPWVLFVATASHPVWMISSVLISKAGFGESFEQFKQRILNRARK